MASLSPQSVGYHGTGGYLTVSSPPDATPLGTTFAQSGKYLGYPNSDLNGPLQSAFAIPQVRIRETLEHTFLFAFLFVSDYHSLIEAH